jgi:type I restriction enzyme M protein
MAISAKRFRTELKEKGIFYTDENLAKEMKTLIPFEAEEVYDPTCGDGSLLAVFDDHVKKYGQDILPEQIECAKERLKNCELYVGDTLEEPAFKGRKFKAIVANPPFSIKWNPDKLKDDQRFASAPVMPPQGKADYAFLLHILDYLADDGVAVVLNFPGILYRGQREGKIRQWMVRQNVIDKVMHIPGGHFEDTKIPTALLVLRKNRTSTDIEFVDTEHNLKRLVPFEEIEQNGFTLSVPVYVAPEAQKEVRDPVKMQNDRRRCFKEHLKSELKFDLAVCQLEALREGPFSFATYVKELHTILDEAEQMTV